jgi:hypothetical protein
MGRKLKLQRNCGCLGMVITLFPQSLCGKFKCLENEVGHNPVSGNLA